VRYGVRSRLQADPLSFQDRIGVREPVKGFDGTRTIDYSGGGRTSMWCDVAVKGVTASPGKLGGGGPACFRNIRVNR
jgi:hypothetical protein